MLKHLALALLCVPLCLSAALSRAEEPLRIGYIGSMSGDAAAI